MATNQKSTISSRGTGTVRNNKVEEYELVEFDFVPHVEHYPRPNFFIRIWNYIRSFFLTIYWK